MVVVVLGVDAVVVGGAVVVLVVPTLDVLGTVVVVVLGSKVVVVMGVDSASAAVALPSGDDVVETVSEEDVSIGLMVDRSGEGDASTGLVSSVGNEKASVAE